MASLQRKVREFNSGTDGSAFVVFSYKGKLSCFGEQKLVERAASTPLLVRPAATPDRDGSVSTTGSPDCSSSFTTNTETPPTSRDSEIPKEDSGGVQQWKFKDLGFLLKDFF